MNEKPLFEWLIHGSITVTWWLWLSIGVLALLCINTAYCTIDSIIRKTEGTDIILKISPQVIHIGFGLIIFAHLLTALYDTHYFLVAGKGDTIRVEGTKTVTLSQIIYNLKGGYITDMKLKVVTDKQESLQISPNNPIRVGSSWVYLKQLLFKGSPHAVIEISRDPGAVWALAGGILFAIGTATLSLRKISTSVT
ncbi:MAG: hypothetical protein D6726_07830 [Nitrospirae bacterium]|nr:MAG: hypothetical protein D6726_07830 [Nitrospirota bacterium]